MMSPLVQAQSKSVMTVDQEDWRAHIIAFLADEIVPSEVALQQMQRTSPLLICVSEEEAKNVMAKMDEGICGNHIGTRTLAHKALRQGYYWPTMKLDTINYVQHCDKCQRFGDGGGKILRRWKVGFRINLGC